MDDASFAKLQARVNDITEAVRELAEDNRDLKRELHAIIDSQMANFGHVPAAVEHAARVLARIEGR
jgi:hypothetical protein